MSLQNRSAPRQVIYLGAVLIGLAIVVEALAHWGF